MQIKEESEEKSNITVVNKGLFYYIFYVLSIPFKILYWLIKKVYKYICVYFGWYKEYLIHDKKTKQLNKVISRNFNDEII